MMKLKSLLRERRVLSVFDFDDTIAKSDAWIYVTRAGRTIKKLDPAQFAVYKPRPGEDFDFKDFDRKIRNPRLIKQNADLLRKQLDKARRAAKGSRKVTILTARRLGAPVTSFLKTMGIDAYVVPLGSANPQDKADWIETQIRKGYDTVYFMDDSNKNIAAVKNMLRRYPKVKSITKLIKEKISKPPIKFSKFLENADNMFESLTPKPEEVIDVWREKNKANVKNWTGGSMHAYYCRRDNCGPAAQDFKSFARQQYGIELESPFPNKTQGFFRADKVVSGKKDFTKEMKQEFLEDGGNFNSAKERESWIENSKYSEAWKYIPHYWLVDKKGNIYDPVGQEQFVDKKYAKDLDKNRYVEEDPEVK